VSDDLERRLGEALRGESLPDAPDTLHAALNRLVAAPVAPPTLVRRRVIPAALSALPVVVVVVAALIVGGYTRIGVSSSPEVNQPASSRQPATQSPLATSAARGDLVASDNGLSMSVTPADPEVEPGGSVTITVTIHNGRSVPVVLQTQTRCGSPALMSFLLPFPVDPAGRVWNGIAGEYKGFALGQAESSGEISLHPWYADANPCHQDHGWVLTLQPGEATKISLVWTAELVEGVPALPGDLDFTVRVGHDPTCSPPPGFTCGPLGSTGGAVTSWGWTFEDLKATGGMLRIVGDAPKVVTAGQAVDALLADHRFSAWLSEEPKSSWSVANVTLLNYGPAQGIVPAGPSWEVDLIREIGVTRNLAIGYVDPFTGELRNLTFE
jgi:hypothetical protein